MALFCIRTTVAGSFNFAGRKEGRVIKKRRKDKEDKEDRKGTKKNTGEDRMIGAKKVSGRNGGVGNKPIFFYQNHNFITLMAFSCFFV